MTIVLRNADIRSVLPFMGNDSVDCIATDPPYSVISGGTPDDSRRPSGILAKNDGKIFTHNDITPDQYLAGLYRVLKPGGHIYIMTNFLNLELFMSEMRRVGFDLHNLLIWKKQNATPNRWYMKNGEYVIFGRKGLARQINDCGSMTVHEFKNPTRNKNHPTEKPVDLMRLYVENSTSPGDLVFDPFAGSGSTGVACMETGRRFLGVEMDHQYYITACCRLKIMPK